MISVLVIDDEEIDGLILTTLLQKGNVTNDIVYKTSGTSALEYLTLLGGNKASWPTHIFIDINMPNMNGFEFIDSYLKLPNINSQNVKVFILSSSSSPSDINRAHTYPSINEYLFKPISLKVIQRLVNDKIS